MKISLIFVITAIFFSNFSQAQGNENMKGTVFFGGVEFSGMCSNSGCEAVVIPEAEHSAKGIGVNNFNLTFQATGIRPEMRITGYCSGGYFYTSFPAIIFELTGKCSDGRDFVGTARRVGEKTRSFGTCYQHDNNFTSFKGRYPSAQVDSARGICE